MTGTTPQAIWERIEQILQNLPAASEQMKHGKTGLLRDAGTKHYVDLVDELGELMLELRAGDVTREIAGFLAVTYGGAF